MQMRAIPYSNHGVERETRLELATLYLGKVPFSICIREGLKMASTPVLTRNFHGNPRLSTRQTTPGIRASTLTTRPRDLDMALDGSWQARPATGNRSCHPPRRTGGAV